MDYKLQAVRDRTAVYMEKIAALFKPGVRITLCVRTPGYPDRDFLMTDDDMSEAVALIQRRMAATKSET